MAVRRRWRQHERRVGVGEDVFEVAAPDPQRLASQIATVEGEEVEHDVVGRAGGGELTGPGAGRSHPLQQRREVQRPVTPDHEFAVDDDVTKGADSLGDLREPGGQVGASS